MFIQTKVTLTDGKEVNAYYLDEEGYAFLQEIKTLFTRVENLESQVENLQKLLKTDLKNQLRDEFMKNLALMPSERSFRYSDFLGWLREKMKLHWKYAEIIDEIFEEAIKEGKIEDRGSGWYRRVLRS